MQPKNAVGIVLALLTRDTHADQRTAILQAFAPPLRSEVERILHHLEAAPLGSAERASRMEDLLRPRAPKLAAWPEDPRVASLLGAMVDPLASNSLVTLPLPRRRYQAPPGLRQFLIAQAEEMNPRVEGPWPA